MSKQGFHANCPSKDGNVHRDVLLGSLTYLLFVYLTSIHLTLTFFCHTCGGRRCSKQCVKIMRGELHVSIFLYPGIAVSGWSTLQRPISRAVSKLDRSILSAWASWCKSSRISIIQWDPILKKQEWIEVKYFSF